MSTYLKDWKRPEHTTVVPRKTAKGIRFEFQFRVRRGRPDNFPEYTRLPLDKSERFGDGRPKELVAVERDARKLLDRLEAAKLGIEATEGKGTMRWVVGRWQTVSRYNYDDLMPRTKDFYDGQLKKIYLWDDMTGNRTLDKITWPNIVELLDAFDDRPRVKQGVRGVLNILFGVAKDEGVIEVTPFVGEGLRRTSRKRASKLLWKPWYPETVERAVRLCDGQGRASVGSMIMAGFDMMQYPDQLISMRYQTDYDHKAGFFEYTRKKTSEEGLVKASARLMDRLSPPKGIYLFADEDTGLPYDRRKFNKLFRKLMDQDPDLQGIMFKHLRHCGAADARRSGLGWDDIALIGAWKSNGDCENSISKVIDQFYTIPDYERANQAQQKRDQQRENRAKSVGRLHKTK